MTLDKAREILEGATWAHETSPVALLDEIVNRYDEPFVDRNTGKKRPGRITRAFADYERGCVASGRVVQLLISLRQQNGVPLYELVS